MVPSDWNKTLMDQDILWTHPESNFDVSSLPSNFFQAFSPQEQAMELVWRNGLANLPNTNNEIAIPFNVVTHHGFDFLRDLTIRLGQHLNTQIVVIMDISVRAFRLYPFFNLQLSPLDLSTHHLLSDLVQDALQNGLEIPVNRAHIPRPPNSFILYRQHHHHPVTAANPGVPNTEISRMIADMWRNETPDVRKAFKELADEKARLHKVAHPNYQYSPRRPSEKARRTPRVHMNTMPWLSQHPLGQRLVDAAVNNRGYIPIDDEFIAAMDAIDLLRGPNGIAPPLPDPDASDIAKDVERQLTDHDAMTAVHWEPLQGNEFDDTFPMDEMLNLEGA